MAGVGMGEEESTFIGVDDFPWDDILFVRVFWVGKGLWVCELELLF